MGFRPLKPPSQFRKTKKKLLIPFFEKKIHLNKLKVKNIFFSNFQLKKSKQNLDCSKKS